MFLHMLTRKQPWSGTMARFMGMAYADREQDIERWEIDLAAASAARKGPLIARLQRQIAEAKQIIADSGY
jgi:uncharacterized membrane protein